MDRVVGAVDERIGLDAQAANWAVDGERPGAASTSRRRSCATPRAATSSTSTLFLSIYPWALRRALRPVARSIMTQYHDPRTVLVDVASNLHQGARSTAGCRRCSTRPTSASSAADHRAEVRRYFARDRRLWLLMQRLRRADRAWQRRVRRRPYPFLLPPPYRYGPPELPERRPA